VYPEIAPGEFIVRTNDLFSPVSGRSLVRERDADLVESGLDRDTRCLAAVAFLIADLRIPVVQVYALAVDRDLELLAPTLPSTRVK
jgi:hypothetical protein